MSDKRARLSAFAFGLLLAATLAVPAAAGGGDHFRGRLVSYHGEDRTMTRTVAAGYALESAGKYFRLSFRDTSLARHVGHDVELSGTRHGRSIEVAGYRLLPDGTATTASSSLAATQNTNVAVILFNFQNDAREPYTPAYAAGVFFNNNNSVVNYFAEQSYGQMAMTGQVFGWYTIDYDNVGCDFATWGDAAKAKAQAGGANFTGYTNFVYAFAKAPGCAWSGLAYAPGHGTFNNESMTLRTTAHELSHNFAVHHASSYNCVSNGVRVSLSATSTDCTLSEYGDPFTIMGGGQWRHSHAWHKAQMGWLGGAGDRLNVTAEGAYTLAPQEFAASTPKLIRVARAGDAGRYFYLELRRPYGSYFDNFAASDPAVNGVLVRLGPDFSTMSQSWLLDATPSTSSWSDAALPVGKTLTDPLSHVNITTKSVSGSGAVVYIGFTPDTARPTAPTNLQASGTGATTAALSWGPATDERWVAGYRVSRNGTVVATTTGLSWSDTGLTPNTTYSYSVVAFDNANNASLPATASATTLPDTQAPSAPTNLTATVSKGGVTALAWGASTDANGVAGYRLYRNGSLFATTTATSYSAKKARGTWTWYVVAFDAGGNVSGQSNSVTVTVR
jgi:hypothetical protein